jgi:hypothetical protein
MMYEHLITYVLTILFDNIIYSILYSINWFKIFCKK